MRGPNQRLIVANAYPTMRLAVAILCVLWRYARSEEEQQQQEQQQPWSLQRAEADESRVVFQNTTVTGKLMLCSWTWRDSLAGVWDTSLRVSLANSSFRSGCLEYRDGYGNEMLRVRWQQSPLRNLTWKALFASKFPPTPWNMSSVYLDWGYRPSGEFSWAFYVDGYSFEPKPTANKVAMAQIEDALGLWLRRRKREVGAAGRRKRAIQPEPRRSTAFSLMDLFTGDGIFSQVPQMVINIFSFFANLFPPEDDGYQAAGDYSTEPDAEVITKPTTQVAAESTTPAL